MNVWRLIAQAADPNPYWLAVLTGIVGIGAGLIPGFVQALKARRQESRADRESAQRMTITEQRQLVKDLRYERDEVKREIAELRNEHSECLEKAARQTEQIDYLKQQSERHEEKIRELKLQVRDLQQDRRDDSEI